MTEIEHIKKAAPMNANYPQCKRVNSGWWDWVFLLPLVAAAIVAFLRFPLLQNDPHLEVVKFIAREWRWPRIDPHDPANQAQHMLVHHTLAAMIYRGLESLGNNSPFHPGRGVQLLSLLWAGGIVCLVWATLHRLIEDAESRILAFLAFGTFTAWICSAVTIDNDMAMSFWGNGALLLAIMTMQRERLPRYREAVFLGGMIGIGSLMKATASIMIPVAVVSVLLRRWLYRDPGKALLLRSLVVVGVWLLLASPNYIRNYHETGYLVCHRDLLHPPGKFYPDERWHYFSFRFPSILRRPFDLYRIPIGDERVNRADYSFWSKLYLTCWRLPDFLPDKAEPRATSSLFLVALPISLCGVIGFFRGASLLRRRPEWIPVIGWLGIGLVGMLIGTWYLPTIISGSFNHARFISYATGGQIAVLALGFRTLIKRWPRLRWFLWGLVSIQLIVFWWLLLSGPFYSFAEPWPKMISP